MKIVTKIMIVAAMFLAVIGYLVFDAFMIAPAKFTTRYESLYSQKIPVQLDGKKILFFSDLDYGTFMDETRMTSLVRVINSSGADFVVFGGDLFDLQYPFTDEDKATVSSLLAQIEAPLGKFAVNGDTDCADEDTKNAVSDVLRDGDFELLNNKVIRLRNKGSASIILVGLENGLNGKQKIEDTYESVSRDAYVITVCHTPDTADELPGDLTDYMLAGHSHGGQANYFFGSLYTPAMAVEYMRGKHRIGNAFTLDISNGTGTTKKDVRFMANAEIVIYDLYRISPPEEKPEEEETPEENSADSAPSE